MELKNVRHDVDFCVVGGGLSGMCAAIAASRQGIKTLLMHERPVLGGNASSEIRMWVCGANDFRETGIIEEIQLESLYRNPYKIYSVWDSILYGIVKSQKNLTLLLNCSCNNSETKNDKILSISGWQQTTQTNHTVFAKYFADTSGDSILAPLCGAEYRIGRESFKEFGEITSIEIPDKKTMGMSCLIQARKCEKDIEYIPPTWAKKLTAEEFNRRKPNLEESSENFWYLELGGDRDSIYDTEEIRDDLLALAFGYWNYYKNSGEFDSAKWQLDFVGFLPGKRESRRLIGDYILKQQDVLSGGKFEDVVAFGGWSLDDHHPEGFYHPGVPNTFGTTPSPYGIPYRSLYSKNIENLFFAGRNISATHLAISSTRVMATCALLGQAIGEAAAIATENSVTPRGVYQNHIKELQQRLMDNDCYLPYTTREVSPLTKKAVISANGENIELLLNGVERNIKEQDNGSYINLGSDIVYTFSKPEKISKIRIVFDSDLERKTINGDWCESTHTTRSNIKPDSPIMNMPLTLVKEFDLSYTDENGNSIKIISENLNIKRFIKLEVSIVVKSITLTPKKMWGASEKKAHIFAFEVK